MNSKKTPEIIKSGLLKRFFTNLIDFLFVLFINYYIKKFAGISVSPFINTVMWLGLWLIYEGIFTSISCTLGQYLTKERVRQSEDITKKLSLGTSFKRILIKLPTLVLFVFLLLKKDAVAIHDKIAKSVVIEPDKEEIKTVMSNKWVKYSLISILYLLWVIWLGNYFWLIGLGVIFDMYITQFVPWDFWNLFKSDKNTITNITVEWFDAIIFAVIAASFIRMFFIELYTIPTSSMEKSLLIGDYLFVSKFHYGPRTPNTPIAFPFVHHTMPFTKFTPSFSTAIQNDYKRLSGLTKIKRDDPVVFNFPEGDTVMAEKQDESYYQRCRDYGREYVWKRFTILARPVDKRENYIKRCVAIPGDTLLIEANEVIINGKKQKEIPGIQYIYIVTSKTNSLNPKVFTEIGVSNEDMDLLKSGNSGTPVLLTAEMADILRKKPFIKSVERFIQPKGVQANGIFPHDTRFRWNVDYFGPIVIPAKGVTININIDNLPLYKRIIEVYENNELKIDKNKIIINGVETSEYTFKMDYYWMMGDNRNNSQDSRFWGFVPEDHIVGTPILILTSHNQNSNLPFPFNVRLDRVLKILD